jgi:predicted RecB family nuclease
LGGISIKELARYENKGIFTVKQLSHLYRPPKRKRRSKPHPALHRYELQALALRTGNIYLHDEPVAIPHSDTEIFIDFESIPDENFYYLFGVVIVTSEKQMPFQFWAENQKDEGSIWHKFIALVEQYPASPLFHYGNFERVAIQKWASCIAHRLNLFLTVYLT